MRVEQIRLAGKVVRGIARVPGGQSFLDTLERIPLTRSALETVLAYQRPFKTLHEAEESMAKYRGGGHVDPTNMQHLLFMSQSARPSDYAALFHLQQILPRVRRIFDLGGNVGNLYYCYAKYLKDMEDISWVVMDLPDNIARGKELAEQRGASQLSFTDSWKDADGCDLLIASGCLHYFERPLSKMLEELEKRPNYILINRTPLTEGLSVATVQDNGAYRTACVLHNLQDLKGGLQQIGYDIDDQWRAAELSLDIPAHPEHRIPSYSGMFMHQRAPIH
jgi:putative methyltransferase (TIGR04325 family)